MSKSKETSRRVIWCDTEGGVRSVPLWDVTFIDEGVDSTARAVRFFNVSVTTKQSRQKLRKSLPAAIFATAVKTGRVFSSTHTFTEDGTIQEGKYTMLTDDLPTAVKHHILDHKGSVLCAWNLKAHDKHVLTNAVGKETLSHMVLWDALPWFKTQYCLPKNTLANAKPGTPRSVFKIKEQGVSHTSLADACHLRELVLRAMYCMESKDTKASKDAKFDVMFQLAHKEIESLVNLDEWTPIQLNAWGNSTPLSVLKE